LHGQKELSPCALDNEMDKDVTILVKQAITKLREGKE